MGARAVNIMPPLFLNSSDSNQVASARMLQAMVGSPPSRLLIFTGIARPGLVSNGQLDGQEVTIDLNARSNTRDPQYTATVGLASIDNTDSDLIFATDDVRVVTGRDLELLLVCNIAVLGDRSVLHRFAYQATVLLEGENGIIEGTVRWDSHYMINAGSDQDLFQINAVTAQVQVGPGGSVTSTFNIVRTGATIGPVVRQGRTMSIAYAIHDLPLGVGITVTVAAKPGAFVTVNTPTPLNFFQVSGPMPTLLTSGHLLEKPVDFEAQFVVGLR
jgi:hypothetical protein